MVTWQWQLQQKLGIQAVIFYFRTRSFLISACQRRLAPTAEGAGEERCPSAPGGGRHAPMLGAAERRAAPTVNHRKISSLENLGSAGIFLYANLLKTKSGRSYVCKSSEIV